MGYPTPEEAALAEWLAYPQVEWRVIRVEYEDDDTAVVVMDMEPSHQMWNHCFRTPDGWVFCHDHN